MDPAAAGQRPLHRCRVVDLPLDVGEVGAKVASPRFASYAAVRRGVGHERELAEWCRWLVEALERGAASGTLAVPPETVDGPAGTA